MESHSSNPIPSDRIETKRTFRLENKKGVSKYEVVGVPAKHAK